MFNPFNTFFRGKAPFGGASSSQSSGPLNARYLIGATIGSILLIFYAVSTD